MKLDSKALAALCLLAAGAGAERAAAATEPPCAWAMPSGDTLVFKPDRAADPRGKAALPRPPAGAVALRCKRDSIVVEQADFRVLRELRMPYVVDHAGRTGVLEAPPSVVFNYHAEGDRFVRGRAPGPQEQKTRT